MGSVPTPSAAAVFSLFTKHQPSLNSSLSSINSHMAAASSLSSLPSDDDDDRLCSETAQQKEREQHEDCSMGPPSRYLGSESRIERAWAHWKKLGQPKLIVAPMVDNSELTFRMLCRKYGAEAAYTPMLHSRIFIETQKHRTLEFTTCKRIARRGNYGAFLMDKLPLIKSLVEKLALNLNVPVSCKIRIFTNLQDTVTYARMLEDAGCSLLAVHGRTRDEKDSKKLRANWGAIKAVRDAVRIPVLANGNVRHMDDVHNCLKETGADGVLSAEALLENPALFAGFQTAEWALGSEENFEDGKLDQTDLLVEYLKLCEKYPVPWRMIRAHVHKLMGEWFRIYPHVREDLNAQSTLTFVFLYDMIGRLRELGRIPLYVKEAHAEEIYANGTGP
ncbi:TRNA-dihydrouridine(16/17) synthase [NAD(P)(+)]-like [Actinidia chinensis var. chinensis]|uniref:tRNA-dihydrouridine(16/17) synthase [NAD(P)(+)]-like n=2 Tax=Actinidia chinensis var. chinensis TaxID=1590841 RepID=A0A2R6S1D7_ACTCC|nr:TRNA-dihydrouridine(16/17) synthase [NAD(P)(+)]-like [Actinidia chinensis var. chinensis]